MEQINVKVLSSKRLTKSFKENKSGNIWESIGLSQDEAERIIAHAIQKLTPDSEPLTVTITVN